MPAQLPVANGVVFGDAQQKIGGKVFRTSYILIRGKTRRSGARGVSVTVDDMGDEPELDWST